MGSLPKTAGVYCFVASTSGKGREFLYIGKAVNIRARVKSHFMSPVFKDDVFILPKTEKIGYIKSDSEIEALLIEAELIKKYRPKYNVIWKDDKNYSFVEITAENVPRVLVSHQTKSNSRYIGPFVDGKALKQSLRIIRRAFPYVTKKHGGNKKCLFCEIKLCPGPCTTRKEKGLYQNNIKNLTKILQGKKQQVLRTLKTEMKKASKAQEFEKAALLRDQVFALENVFANAHIIKDLPQTGLDWPGLEKRLRALVGARCKIKRIEGYDVSNIQGKQATGSMVVFDHGLPDKKEYKRFKVKITGKPDDIAMLKEVLKRRFSHPEWPRPQIILIDGGKGQLNAAVEAKKETPECREIKVLAIAKRKNELFIEGKDKPILLKTLPREISNLVLQTRDEAHRFAIAYHRKLRRKRMVD